MTAQLPDEILAWADRLRRAHFPPERNHLKAHVTLFHALPPSLQGAFTTVANRLGAQFAPPAARITGLMNLGGGTAIAVRSPAMQALREQLADHFHGSLTSQDSHPPRLHITIQNKVLPEIVRHLQRELGPIIAERDFRFTGLGLHRYLGGPWEPVGTWKFRGKETVDQRRSAP